MFTAESFAKKRSFETFHLERIFRLVFHLLGKLKASDGKLKEMAGKYISLEEKLKATEHQAFISVSNAKKTLSKKTGQYHRILERWQKQFKEKMALLNGKVQLLEAERGHAVVRQGKEST